MSIIEAIVLGLVQGLTEFIPISSTAHLEIVPMLLGWGDPGAAASAVIQIGTWIAALIYFRADVIRLIGGFVRGLMTRRIFGDTSATAPKSMNTMVTLPVAASLRTRMFPGCGSA